MIDNCAVRIMNITREFEVSVSLNISRSHSRVKFITRAIPDSRLRFPDIIKYGKNKQELRRKNPLKRGMGASLL